MFRGHLPSPPVTRIASICPGPPNSTPCYLLLTLHACLGGSKCLTRNHSPLPGPSTGTAERSPSEAEACISHGRHPARAPRRTWYCPPVELQGQARQSPRPLIWAGGAFLIPLLAATGMSRKVQVSASWLCMRTSKQQMVKYLLMASPRADPWRADARLVCPSNFYFFIVRDHKSLRKPITRELCTGGFQSEKYHFL